MSLDEIDDLLLTLGQGMESQAPGNGTTTKQPELGAILGSSLPKKGMPRRLSKRLPPQQKNNRVTRTTSEDLSNLMEEMSFGEMTPPLPTQQQIHNAPQTSSSEEIEISEIDDMIATLNLGERPKGNLPPPSRETSQTFQPVYQSGNNSSSSSSSSSSTQGGGAPLRMSGTVMRSQDNMSNTNTNTNTNSNTNRGMAPGYTQPRAGLYGAGAPPTNEPAPGDFQDQSNLGTCGTCNQAITGQTIQAKNRFYHPNCFVCGSCGNGLGSGRFFHVKDKPTCQTCYKSLFLERCAHCDEPIQGACIDAIKKKWHVNCFICCQCLKPFGTSMFYERDGNPFCEGCFYGIFSDRCGGCDQPIRGESISACGRRWHPEHFVCAHCKKSFGNTPYFEHNGQPYCQLHFHAQAGKLCGCGCGKQVMGRVIQALGKQYLPGHFTCGFCMNPLTQLKYKEHNGKAYCDVCHSKIFGKN